MSGPGLAPPPKIKLWWLFWVIVHFCSLNFVDYLLKYIDLRHNVIYFLLMGLGITIIAKIVRTYTKKKSKFIVNQFFFLWVIINSVIIFLIDILMRHLQIDNKLAVFSFTAICLVFVARIFSRIGVHILRNKTIKGYLISILILIIVAVVINMHRDERKIESKILELVNEERVRVGVNELIIDSRLNTLANTHSKNMLKGYFFEHSNDNVGENIFESPVYYWTSGCGMTITNNQIAKCIVNGWKGSPGHYANMINSRYSQTGIGVYCNIFECKATQNFV